MGLFASEVMRTLVAELSPADAEQERLLRAAREEFVEHGLRRTSVGDIARHANVSRPTVYRRLGDKDSIVRAVAYLEVIRFFARIQDRIVALESPVERAVAGFVEGIREARTNPLTAAVVKFEPETLTALLVTFDQPPMTTIRDAVAAALADESLPIEDARRATDLIQRIAASLVLSPSDVWPIESDEDAAVFARTYFAPIIEASRTL